MPVVSGWPRHPVAIRKLNLWIAKRLPTGPVVLCTKCCRPLLESAGVMREVDPEADEPDVATRSATSQQQAKRQ
jgi:hypothetical protein